MRWGGLEKGKLVPRTLVARALDREKAGFPLVAQAARVHRNAETTETVELITSRPAEEFSPRQWLAANLAHWGESKPDCTRGWMPRVMTTPAACARGQW